MRFEHTPLDGLKVLTPRRFEDDRGYFVEAWNQRVFSENGIHETFVQDNQSHSVAGTLRGLHYQVGVAQAKLVRCVQGAIFDVAVDLRRSSSTLGKWFGIELSGANLRMLYVPKGFAHGFLVLTPTADVHYKVSAFWSPGHERALAWDDADVGIEWPLVASPLLSPKDAAAQRFPQLELFE